MTVSEWTLSWTSNLQATLHPDSCPSTIVAPSSRVSFKFIQPTSSSWFSRCPPLRHSASVPKVPLCRGLRCMLIVSSHFLSSSVAGLSMIELALNNVFFLAWLAWLAWLRGNVTSLSPLSRREEGCNSRRNRSSPSQVRGCLQILAASVLTEACEPGNALSLFFSRGTSSSQGRRDSSGADEADACPRGSPWSTCSHWVGRCCW